MPYQRRTFGLRWSPELNDWAFHDAVAVEMGSGDASRPLDFGSRGDARARRLTETTVVFKRSCFVNAKKERRLACVEQEEAALAIDEHILASLQREGSPKGKAAGSGGEGATVAPDGSSTATKAAVKSLEDLLKQPTSTKFF